MKSNNEIDNEMQWDYVHNEIYNLLSQTTNHCVIKKCNS